MLRIMIWRFIYHGFCFAKLMGFKGKRVKYFAFGANLDPEVLKRRNIIPYQRTLFTLNHYQLCFNHEVPFKDAAMASIEPNEKHSVPGVVYEIDQIDEKRLDCMEAHIVFKRYGKVYIQGDSLGQFYFYKSNRAKDGLFPTKTYLNKILKGYDLFDPRPEIFIQKLSEYKTIESLEFKEEPGFLIQDYAFFGKTLRPFFVWYDRKCVAFFAKLIFKPSFFEKFY